jgi:hypothetical protein
MRNLPSGLLELVPQALLQQPITSALGLFGRKQTDEKTIATHPHSGWQKLPPVGMNKKAGSVPLWRTSSTSPMETISPPQEGHFRFM